MYEWRTITFFFLVTVLNCVSGFSNNSWKQAQRTREASFTAWTTLPRNVVLFLGEFPTINGHKDDDDHPPKYTYFPIRSSVRACSSVWGGSVTCDEFLNSSVVALISWAKRVRGMVAAMITTIKVRSASSSDAALNRMPVGNVPDLKTETPRSDKKPFSGSDEWLTTERSADVCRVVWTDDSSREQTLDTDTADEVMEHGGQLQELTTDAKLNSGPHNVNGVVPNLQMESVHSNSVGTEKDQKTRRLYHKISGRVPSDTFDAVPNEQTCAASKREIFKPVSSGANSPDGTLMGDQSLNRAHIEHEKAVVYEQDLENVSSETKKTDKTLPDATLADSVALMSDPLPKEIPLSELSLPHSKISTDCDTESNRSCVTANPRSSSRTKSLSARRKQHDTTCIPHPDAFEIFDLLKKPPSIRPTRVRHERSSPASLASLVRDVLRRLTSRRPDGGGFLLVVWGGTFWQGGQQSKRALDLSEAVEEVRDDGQTLVVVTGQCPHRGCVNMPVYALGPGCEVMDTARYLWGIPWAVQQASSGRHNHQPERNL